MGRFGCAGLVQTANQQGQTKMEDIEKALVGTKLSPSKRSEIIEANKALIKDAAARLRNRNKTVLTDQYTKPVISTVVSAAGGAAAEIVRRNLVGRVTTDPRSQGVAMILLGAGVNWVGKRVAYLGPIGQAHAALGGAIFASSFYGSEDKEDPLNYAYKVTTWKHKNPSKEKKAG